MGRGRRWNVVDTLTIDEQLPFMGMETPSNYFKCIFYDGHSLEEEKPSNVDVKMEKPDYDADTEDENMAQPVEPEIQEISTENITQTMANAATSSFSDTNPWILFEAGVTCFVRPWINGILLGKSIKTS